MMDQYAVIGHPVAHSKSPWIHAKFAKNCDDAINYGLLECDPSAEAFSAAIREFIAAGANGANVTMPFKEMAWELADHLTPRATLAGAVNTLTFTDDGLVLGDTTDGVGLVNDLTLHMEVAIDAKRILILGAGGAVKGVVQPLLEKLPACVHIANRTVQRATELVDVFSGFGKITASSYQDVSALEPFDVVINATPANFSGELPPVTSAIFADDSVAYDMSYAATPTLFEQWCKDNGVNKVRNGLGMLVEQAAESFFIWRGKRPETKTVLDELR
ncbi:MAG: shikimate dehydrogenase [Leucothrix sp.]